MRSEMSVAVRVGPARSVVCQGSRVASVAARMDPNAELHTKRPTHTLNQNHENFLTCDPTSTQPEPSPSLSRAAKNKFATHSIRPHTTPLQVTVY